nr:MAG TPA: hypothetical protein [Bacteriophage sp.]
MPLKTRLIFGDGRRVLRYSFVRHNIPQNLIHKTKETV